DLYSLHTNDPSPTETSTLSLHDALPIYKDHKDDGLMILGFPSNDFGSQEPGTAEEIKEFCEINYGVSFPLFEKGPVKGEAIQGRSEEHTSELQSRENLVCRLLLEKKKKK